ncbi:MAG: hypothetical protein IJD92_04595 [Bacilli bacterium]|nr:hypothetical protein [Bacilli bacterium]
MSFILLVISLVLIKFGMNILGIICLIINTIICAKNLRSKGIFNILILILNIIILGFIIFSIFTYTKKVKDNIDEIKSCQIADDIEWQIKNKMDNYGTEKIFYEAWSKNKEYIVSLKDLGYSNLACNCYGYAIFIYDNTPNSKAFIKCDGYITEGFDTSYIK